MSKHSISGPFCLKPVGAALLGVLAALSAPASSQAQTPAAAQTNSVATHRYDLPAGPLAQTLSAIARISGKRIAVDESSTAERSSGAVVGVLSVDQAVAQALAGTPLQARETDSGVLRVAMPDELARVVVVAKRDQAETSFKADRSDTATRSGTSLMDVPQSVTIITSKVLESQQVLSVRDALANVSGVAFTQSPQGSPSFSIRGFSITSASVNGVTDASASLTNVFGVERIEVLKGPQAILAGSGSLGGGVNVVTKKPQAETIRSLLLQYGSHDDATIAGDLSGAITDDKKLSYRLIGAKSKASENAAGFDGRDDESLMPQLRWKDASTDLIVGVSYGKQHAPTPAYTFARRDGYLMPEPALRQGAARDGFDSEQNRAFYQLEQTLSPDITLVSRFQRTVEELSLHVRSPSDLNYNRGASNDSPNGSVTYYGDRSRQDTRTSSGDHYLRIEGDTGPVSHKLSLGVNHSDFAYQRTGWRGAAVNPTIYPADTSFVFPDVEANARTVSSITNSRSDQAGVFAQDLMRWGDWNLLLNLRRTRYTTVSETNYVSIKFVSSSPKTKVWSTTPGVGLVYNLTPSTSLYASYAEGFLPQTTPKCGGGIVDPILTKNKEVGVKFDLLDSKLSLTTAAFELAQSNQLLYDPINNCTTVRNSQVTRGLEADLQGQLAPGWNAILNYTYNTVKDVGDTTTIYPGLAKHKASLWTTYELQNEAWRGLGVGLGVTARTQVDGTRDTTYPFIIPGQAQLDASLFYSRDKWSVTLGVKNIADRRLYGVSTASSYVPVLDGRTYMLTVKRDFN